MRKLMFMTKQIKTPGNNYPSHNNFKYQKLYPLIIYIYHFVSLQPKKKTIAEMIKLDITTITLLKSTWPVKKVPAATPKNTWAIAIKALDQYEVFKEDLAILRKSIPHGQIDPSTTLRTSDARIYNYAFTPVQIKALYNDGALHFGPVTGSP